MATTTRSRRAAAPKAAPVEEPEVDEFEESPDDEDLEEMEDSDEDLEELEEDSKAEKPKRKPPVRPKIDFGSPELAAYATEVTGENYNSRDIRMLLRKLAKDGKLKREIGVDKGRYEFTGKNDPTVKMVIGLIKDGTAKAMKQEGLQKVKDQAAAKKAAKAAAAAKEAEEAEEMEEVEEETSKPTRRRAAAPKAAPAKATATTRRRASSAAK